MVGNWPVGSCYLYSAYSCSILIAKSRGLCFFASVFLTSQPASNSFCTTLLWPRWQAMCRAVIRCSDIQEASTCKLTSNMHAHLCLTPLCRCRWGEHGTCYVCCRRSCLVFVVSKPRWPHCAVVSESISITKEHHWLHLSELNISDCVRLCDAHMAYTYGIMTFCVTFLSVTPYVLCENRSSIQSLALMRLAIKIQCS